LLSLGRQRGWLLFPLAGLPHRRCADNAHYVKSTRSQLPELASLIAMMTNPERAGSASRG
jgi:hypothetical protein